MARSGLLDPLDKFRFVVDIQGFNKLGFTRCEVPSYNITTNTYPEGGSHLNPRQIVERVDYKPITLSRGVTKNSDFAKWAAQAWDTVRNNAEVNSSNFLGAFSPGFQPVSTGRSGTGVNSYQYRRNVVITHMDRSGVAQVQYILYNAFPVEFKPASDFGSGDDDELSIQTLVLSYEGFDVRYASLGNTLIGGTVGSIIGGLL